MTDDSPDVDGPLPAASRADAAAPETVDRLAREYAAAGRPFARVTVVRREPPVSANVGDRAIVTPDGDLVGWVGGAACAKSVVAEEAAAALAGGEPRLVGLAPDPETIDRPGLESYPMTCHSGGTLELFVDPVTPVPRLVVVGDSPIATALARLAGETTYHVTVATDREGPGAAGTGPGADETGPGADEAVPGVDEPVPGADETVSASDEAAVRAAADGARHVVVASMGEYDEVGVAAALRSGASYVGLVASDERRDEVADAVGARLGVDPGSVVAALTTPAGLDVGARTPEEIAVSVLAELVAVRRGADGPIPLEAGDPTALDVGGDDEGPEGARDRGAPDTAPDHAADGGDADTVVDPVCGMDVVVREAAATVEHGGRTYHFCGQGCADAFADDPERYLEEVATGE